MALTRPPRYDPSIIKKKEESEELLVFGYSCKLFRDDEKALYIDQGKHLIPWMGDDTLKIDRYDVRGTVFDLRPLEPLGGDASEALWSTLSDAERKVEQLCDEERYRALYRNEAEEELYQEEELKRLHQALDPQNSYGQVAYSYDNEAQQDESGTDASKETTDATDEDDEPFIPPPELDVPVGMVLPERNKLNAIIEKTAAFINAQGPQMEIILKMKQANNPQFSFLSFDCPLHAYYRHLLMAIKAGRYKTKQQRQQQEQSESETSDYYLHPSLATAAKPVELCDNQLLISDFRTSLNSKLRGDMLDLIELVDKCLGAPSIPSISYKPSADCAYSMLVNKIKDRHGKLASENSGSGSPENGIGGEDHPSGIVAPPPDVQVIIDKMASYVFKNGRDFESVVRSKGDERFAFLDSSHKFYPYYEHKVRVYQGLEQPIDFSLISLSNSNSSSQKLNYTPMRKKLSPEKNKRPILLPGYECSDDSSESEDETDETKLTSRGKPKLAPVCFSIKKPKEAEILKDVKSALPVEEESSEGEADIDGEVTPKVSSQSVEIKPVETEHQEETCLPKDPEEEMRRLQALLKQKEQELREQEKKRVMQKRSLDIFQIEPVEISSLPPSNISHPQLDVQAEVLLSCNQSIQNTNQTVFKRGDDLEPVQQDNENIVVDTKDKSEPNVKLLNIDDLVTEVTEAEVIDLTEEPDETPRLSDTMRQERKRKAEAFLNRLKKGHSSLNKNGNPHPASDSDTTSRHSSPSPTRSKREKAGVGSTSFHEATIPRTSLKARLAAASSNMITQRQSKKIEVRPKSSSNQRQSDSQLKGGRDREDKVPLSSRSRRRRTLSSSSESEGERIRSRSRSTSYSRSPSRKRRQGEDSDPEHRSQRYHKEEKSGRRRKHESADSTEQSWERSRHYRKHEEERRCVSFTRGHSQARDRLRSKGRGHSHSHSHVHTHGHPKRSDQLLSGSESSD